MKENREIDNQKEFEKSLGDRVYLGVLIFFGITFGSGALLIIASCYIKIKTDIWPTWL